MKASDDTPVDATSPPPNPPPPLATFPFENGVPRAVQNHGQLVDPHQLEAGDVLLVCLKKSRGISLKIQQYQSQQFPEQHSRWHHAVVCGGGLEICEATTSGVRAHEYWQYMTGQYDLKLRRLKEVTDAERAKVAYFAATMVRTRYGFESILSLFNALREGNFRQRSVLRSPGVICSQLYFEACMRVGVLLNPVVRPDLVCPAHLSASNNLDDIPLHWVRVQ
jgi:hypothetical protein